MKNQMYEKQDLKFDNDLVRKRGKGKGIMVVTSGKGLVFGFYHLLFTCNSGCQVHGSQFKVNPFAVFFISLLQQRIR